MLLRKINAVLSLLTAALVLTHAVSMSVGMLSRGSIPQVSTVVPRTLAGFLALHAFISIYLVSSVYMEGTAGGCKHYAAMNRGTFFQRVSGCLLVVFTALHIGETAGALRPPHVIHAILSPLFFAVALAHTAVSVEKAFVTLGIGGAGLVRTVGVVSRAVCAATLIAAIAGFFLRVW